MPFKSDAQRRFMFAKHPGIAKRWAAHTPKGKDLPEHVKKAVDAAKATFAPLEIKLPPQPKPLEVTMPAPGALATPIGAPSLAKLKAVATRKLASTDEQEPTITEGKKVPEAALTTFFRANPTPEDANIHELAEAYGTDPHTLEEQVYQLLGEKLKTSAELSGEDIAAQLKAHDRPDSAFRPDQLAKGIEVEKEHSDSLPVRKAITKGHLVEFDNYYDPLAKMEDELKAGKTAAYGLGVRCALQQFSKTAGILLPSAIGAGIGALAAGPENRLRGALMGAGTGAGANLGARAIRRFTGVAPGSLLSLAGGIGGGIGGYHAGRAIAPERTRA